MGFPTYGIQGLHGGSEVKGMKEWIEGNLKRVRG